MITFTLIAYIYFSITAAFICIAKASALDLKDLKAFINNIQLQQVDAVSADVFGERSAAVHRKGGTGGPSIFSFCQGELQPFCVRMLSCCERWRLSPQETHEGFRPKS